MTSQGARTFWLDDVSIIRSPVVGWAGLVGHNQITDAHLLALAIRNQGQLVTFYRAIRQLLLAPEASGSRLVVLA